MQFFEKQFQSSQGFILIPTGVESLANLIQNKIDLSIAFAIYQWDDIHNPDTPIVWHSGEFRWEMLAPIVSFPEDTYDKDKNGRKVYMLDPDENSPKLIQVPTGIPLVGMRDSYRYQFAMQKFYTWQSIEQILAWLRKDWWKDFLYTSENTWPMDFTPISELRKNLKQL